MKLIDFGVSENTKDEDRDIMGTPYFFSPHKQMTYKYRKVNTIKEV